MAKKNTITRLLNSNIWEDIDEWVASNCDIHDDGADEWDYYNDGIPPSSHYYGYISEHINFDGSLWDTFKELEYFKNATSN